MTHHQYHLDHRHRSRGTCAHRRNRVGGAQQAHLATPSRSKRGDIRDKATDESTQGGPTQ